MLEKNQFFNAEIEDITSEGSGVCRIDGFTVFVPETAVGDVIRGKIVKVLKSYAYGIVDKIINFSADRVENDCIYYKKCGGCIFRHISYEAECRIKNNIVKNAFRRLGGLNPVFENFIGAEQIYGYRNKAQYPVAAVDGKAVCGFFAPRSHRIVSLTNCTLQPKVFKDILETVLKYINEKKISAYCEESHTGIIRHIYLRKGTYSGEIMVCIVVRKDISRQLVCLCNIISERYPDVKSIIMNINPVKTNVILGKKCVTLWGNNTISDFMSGNKIKISPLSFYQVNTVQAEHLYAKALEYAAPETYEIVADLYCGTGTIGLSMAGKAKKIIGIEIVPQAVENAIENARLNNISNAEYYCGDAGKVFEKLQKSSCTPDIIVIDPPRKGCSPETINAIAKAAPKKIVMISCNPATAARDAKILSNYGYITLKVTGTDLFPRTRHVECVVLLSKVQK